MALAGSSVDLKQPRKWHKMKRQQRQNPEYPKAIRQYETAVGILHEPGGYYTKWNKPDLKRQILHDFTPM